MRLFQIACSQDVLIHCDLTPVKRTASRLTRLIGKTVLIPLQAQSKVALEEN